jgi:imidazole glycerol-phosphate synthase subunit HisH
MELAIVKYNAGNIQSVLYALERIGVNGKVTDDISEIQSADKVIFPGVGEASSAMGYLKDRNLDMVIRNLQQPVLGICLGMQLLCAWSEENDTDCLDVIPIRVKKFSNKGANNLKTPQIGWNNIFELRSSLFKNVKEDSYIYNVHSYYAEDSKYTIAKCNYGLEYAAAISNKNFYGVQFHTEKSSEVGEQILKNFLEEI